MSLKINPILPKQQPAIKSKLKITPKVADKTKQTNQAVKHLAVRFNGNDETKPPKKTVGNFYRENLQKDPINKNVGLKYDITLGLDVGKSTNKTTVEDYTKAFDRAIFNKAGYTMLTDSEVKTAAAEIKGKDWKQTNWSLNNLRAIDNKPGQMYANTNQYTIEQAKRAGEAVLNFRKYESETFDKNQAGVESETNQKFVDQARVGYNSIVNTVEGTINTGIDLIRLNNGRNPLALVDPFRPQVNLSGIKADYRSQMMRTDINGKLDGNGLKRGDFTEGAVTILAPLVVGRVATPTNLNTLKGLNALPEATIVPKALPKIGKLQIEKGRSLSPSEQNFADKMLAEGKDVRARTEVNLKGIKNPDFEVEGKLTEFKHVSDLKGTNADKLSGGLSRRILDGGSQAPKVTLNVTDQVGMTKEIAERAISRAFGNQNFRGSDKIKEIRIYGKDFDITIPFIPKSK
jgi:Contact-dependent growth inhibition CdiA C-terminal domain